MRHYLALEFDPPLRSHLFRVQQSLRTLVPSASFTKPENLHLTLKFLGQVPDADVPRLADALQRIPVPPLFPLAVTGLLCFPPRGAIRIITAAFAEPTGALQQLHSCIEAATDALGFPREVRAYHPHTTLARARHPLPTALRPRLSAAIDSLPAAPAQLITGFALIDSHLSPGGPIYTPTQHFHSES